MNTARRLLHRLREAGLEIPEGAFAVHSRRPRGRKFGGWSWHILDPWGGDLHIGSKETMTTLLRAGSIHTRTMPLDHRSRIAFTEVASVAFTEEGEGHDEAGDPAEDAA